MGDSFKAMSGKSVGNIMTYISNPIAGIMIGIVGNGNGGSGAGGSGGDGAT